MDKKTDDWQGTLALMALRTLEIIGPLHAYGIARYRLTRAGRKQFERAARQWEQTTEIISRFLAPGGRSL
jgi:PadR family transcriptional regulator, regulatory protein PadR